jgi:hypothetical protein
MKCGFILAVLLQVLAPTKAFAQETRQGPLAVNVWGASLHLGKLVRPPTQTNWGLGFRYYLSGPGDKSEVYIDANAFRNSTGGLAVSWGAGYQYSLCTFLESDLLCGFTAGILQYQNKWWDTVSVMFAAYPYLGLRRENTTLAIGYLPATWVKGERTPPVLFTYVSIKL